MKKGRVSSSTAGKTFSRRKLIKSTFASAFTLTSAHKVHSETEGQKKKAQCASKPLFRFLQVNDLQIQNVRNKHLFILIPEFYRSI